MAAKRRRQCHEVEHAVLAMACRTCSCNAANECDRHPMLTVMSWSGLLQNSFLAHVLKIKTHAKLNAMKTFTPKTISRYSSYLSLTDRGES